MALIETEEHGTQARIKVVGVGGGGGNAINTMIASGLESVEFLAANTDVQALESNLATTKLQLGQQLTRGLGAGANPEVGASAALEDTDRIREVLEGADMVFVAAGMGGGTGTGAAPVIAKVAKELGALTVGVVTKPFRFEGGKRMRQAELGIQTLQQEVDTLITIPNQRLLSVAGQSTSMLDAFRKVDEVLLNAVQGISDLVVIHGFINVDFADVRTVMAERGQALMGTGYAAGDRKAFEAAQQAIASPLLEDARIDGATGILINITGGPDLTLFEIDEATNLIMEAAHPEANIIFGSVIDANLEDQVRITVIATGFDAQHMDARLGMQRSDTTGRSHSSPQQVVQPRQQSRQMTAPPQPQPLQHEYALATAPTHQPAMVAGRAIPHAPPLQQGYLAQPQPMTHAAPPSAAVQHAQMAQEGQFSGQPWPSTHESQLPQRSTNPAQGAVEHAQHAAAQHAAAQHAAAQHAAAQHAAAQHAAAQHAAAQHAAAQHAAAQHAAAQHAAAQQAARTAAVHANTNWQHQPRQSSDAEQTISIEAQPPSRTERRPRRTTGQQSVPGIHPSLTGLTEEQEMDIPTFLRRKGIEEGA